MLRSRGARVVVGVLALLVIAVVGAVLMLDPPGDDQMAEPARSTPAAPPVASASPSVAATVPEPPPCTTVTGSMAAPTRFTVERMGVDSPILVVGEDDEGNPGAPPANEPYTTAWYDGSPSVGSPEGNVILTIHTYSKGQALGNDLYGAKGLREPTKGAGLREGDVVKISDAQGNQVCYRYTRDHKVWVESYDPASGVFHNPDGPPQLAIMICWDYVPRDNDWDSRIIFYADLIPEGTPV